MIFQRRHNWIMCWLYTGTFGSFIGYSAGFPLLTKTLFPEVNVLQFAFLGPLVGALARSGAGWLADKYGGARVTFWVFVLMMAGVAGVLWFIAAKDQPGAFWGFFVAFLVLFFATGVGNASTFQMIPTIMAKEIGRLMPQADAETRRRHAEKESGRDHRLHLRYSRIWCVLYPQELRERDRPHWQPISSTLGLSYFLCQLPRHYMVCLCP